MYHQGVHNPRNVKCNKCDSYFKTERSLKKHMNIHKKEKNLTKQIRTVDKNGKRKQDSFSCDFCGNIFETKASICNHMRSHIKSRVTCEFCKRRYSKENLKEHQGSEICRRRYKCKFLNCGKIFVSRHNALQHQVVHNPRNIKCKECARIEKITIISLSHSKILLFYNLYTGYYRIVKFHYNYSKIIIRRYFEKKIKNKFPDNFRKFN
jgi:hypothetical protein